MNTKKLEIKKHSAIVQVSNKVSLQQRKCFNALIYIARDSLIGDDDMIEFRIDLATIKKLSGVNATNNKQIKTALEKLVGTVVTYNILGKDKSDEWGTFAMLSQATIKKGVLYFAFPPIIHKTLLRPEMYTPLDLSIIKGLRSKYSVALYELLKDYRAMGCLKISISEFRELMGVKKAYKDFGVLRHKVINVAVNDINEKTDLTVSYEFYKLGNKIVDIEFFILEENGIKKLEPHVDLKNEELYDILKKYHLLSDLQASLIIERLSKDRIMAISEDIGKKIEKGEINNIGAYSFSAFVNGFNLGKSEFIVEKETKEEQKKQKLVKKKEMHELAIKYKREFDKFIDEKAAKIIKEITKEELDKGFENWLKFGKNIFYYQRLYKSKADYLEKQKRRNEYLIIYIKEMYLNLDDKKEEEEFKKFVDSKGYDLFKEFGKFYCVIKNVNNDVLPKVTGI